jgi:hypothetical protein
MLNTYFFILTDSLTFALQQRMLFYKRFFVRGQEQELSLASIVLR